MSLLKEKSRILALLELVVISTAPILLFLFDGIPVTRLSMFVTLATVFLITVVLSSVRVFTKKWKLTELGYGVVTNNALRNHAALAILGFFSLLLFQSLYTGEGANIVLPFHRLLAFSILGSLFQEFLYRSYSIRLCEDIFPNEFAGRNALIALINIFSFAFLHTIFTDWQVLMPLTLIGGTIFTLLYMRHRSFLLVSVVHGILNYAALSFGFFAL